MPEVLTPEEARRERLMRLHGEDRLKGLPGAWLPEGLGRKWPHAGEQWEWQWFWPSRETSVDPRSRSSTPHPQSLSPVEAEREEKRRRHHVLDATFQHFIRQAARRAKLDKKVTPHVLEGIQLSPKHPAVLHWDVPKFMSI